MSEDRIERLEKRLAYLEDRQAIIDCIARNARGCDRHDSEMLAGSYHEDGVDEHGIYINAGPDYPAWANAAHNAMSLQTMHNITTHLCEIDGDEANAESYVVGLFLNLDGTSSNMFAGRYADRLEKRDGVWRIAIRRSTVDVVMSGDASLLTSEGFADRGYHKGMRDRRDVSYQRPLTLDETPGDCW